MPGCQKRAREKNGQTDRHELTSEIAPPGSHEGPSGEEERGGTSDEHQAAEKENVHEPRHRSFLVVGKRRSSESSCELDGSTACGCGWLCEILMMVEGWQGIPHRRWPARGSFHRIS
jgi:hypothetical protein